MTRRLMTAEDVNDAMVRAFYDCQQGRHRSDWAKYAIAAAINASGCVLVLREDAQILVQTALDSGYAMDDEEIAGATNRTHELLAAADPREQALDRMAENAQELGLTYDAPQPEKEKSDE